MKRLGVIEKSKNFWFVFANIVLLFFLRLPSLFEPYWYGDEGVYQVLGMGINKGRLLYAGIFDNKTPLLYVFYSFFNGDQFYIRLLSLIFSILSIITIFYLSRKLFKNKISIYLSTFIFTLLIGLPVIEGNIANAENFIIFFVLSAFYLAIDHFRTKWENKLFFWSGLLLGLGFLFKIIALFDFLALVTFLLIVKTPNNFTGKVFAKISGGIKDLYWLIIGFIIPIAATTFFFITQGAFSDFITATLFSNIGYVGYGNKLIIPQGFLILKVILLFAFIIFVFKKRHKLSEPTILIWVWLAFSVFNALFSQRPYTHYLLTLLPSFALLTGLIFENKKLSKLNLIFVLVIIVLAFQSFWVYTKIIPYYQNFGDFVLGNKTVTNYQKFFDKRTPIDYQVAQYVKRNTTEEDAIFIWGNNPQLYKLTNKIPPGKYTVAYHINNYKDGIENTKEGLLNSPPKLIIVMPYAKNFPFSLSKYKPVVVIEDVYIYERVL